MPGSGAQKRYHADALRALKMRKEGMTSRQIAEVLGKQPEQIAKLVQLAERLSDAPRKE
jgi:prolyl-tRNA editing enzyme YbaK/EbsC (Cys-tRNA(Pro) deacylase)